VRILESTKVPRDHEQREFPMVSNDNRRYEQLTQVHNGNHASEHELGLKRVGGVPVCWKEKFVDRNVVQI